MSQPYDDQLSLGERYSTALSSSRLRFCFTQGDVDLVVAAGWTSDSLGVSFMRLRSEFDVLKPLLGKAKPECLADRAMVLAKLPGLESTRHRFGLHALKEAERHKLESSERVVQIIAERVLNVFIDPNCPQCDGRGKVGAYGGPQNLCRPCGGSGRRHESAGKNKAENDFARYLFCQLERKVQAAERSMAKRLRTR